MTFDRVKKQRMCVPEFAHYDYTFWHILLNILYSQANEEDGHQSQGPEEERQESQEVGETGAEIQEGGGSAGDTLTAKVSKLNL